MKKVSNSVFMTCLVFLFLGIELLSLISIVVALVVFVLRVVDKGEEERKERNVKSLL